MKFLIRIWLLTVLVSIDVLLQAQSFIGVIHFKIQSTNNFSSGKSYSTSILTLYTDSSFLMQELSFANKKERRACIVLERNVERGKWHMSKDTIILISNSQYSGEELTKKFFLSGRKLYYISPLFENVEFSKNRNKNSPWKKVNSLNSSIFLKRLNSDISPAVRSVPK